MGGADTGAVEVVVAGGATRVGASACGRGTAERTVVRDAALCVRWLVCARATAPAAMAAAAHTTTAPATTGRNVRERR